MIYKYRSRLLLFIFIVSTSSCVSSKKLEIIGEPKLEEVFTKVLDQFHKAKIAIDGLSDSLRHSKPKSDSFDSLIIKEADVTFDNVVSNSADGSLSILVFKPNYVYTKTKETSVKYSLVNTSLPTTLHPRNKAYNDFSDKNDALAKLIYNAAESFSKIKYQIADDSFLEKNFEVNVSFTVDQNGGIDVSVPNWVVKPELKVSVDVQNKHTMTLIFLIYRSKSKA